MQQKNKPKIGLALGSGGAKGLAHIGIIKVLKENNIPIDFIAGSSIGAMVGGCYAALGEIDEIEKVAIKTDSRRMLSLIDPVFSRGGLVRGEKIKKFFEQFVNGIDISDCKIPFVSVTTDLKNGETVILKKGKLSEAIQASIACPPFFKPVEIESRALCDGGLSMPVPVEVVKKMGADIVIAVNLDGYQPSDIHKAGVVFFKAAQRTIWLLRHHLSVSNIKNADVVIAPPTGRMYWNKFIRGEKVILAGEEAARAILPEIERLIREKTR
ncbi:MAG TPA: patatin-like phospholipase family protein [Candidatus Moranbacteria bacterium]|nr:patatin-like phospholipase family protein [Candidatus Moranbacteria bacterium]